MVGKYLSVSPPYTEQYLVPSRWCVVSSAWEYSYIYVGNLPSSLATEVSSPGSEIASSRGDFKMNPILSLPSGINTVDPAWKLRSIDSPGEYDPPCALQSATALGPADTKTTNPISSP